MARYVHGNRVYDDQLDNWFTFDTIQDAEEWASEDDAFEEQPVTVVASPRINGTSHRLLTSSGTKAFEAGSSFTLASSDVSRQRIRVAVKTVTLDSVGIIVGSRTDILSGNGYYIPSGDDVTIDSSAELWCRTYPLKDLTDDATTIVSVLQEYTS